MQQGIYKHFYIRIRLEEEINLFDFVKLKINQTWVVFNEFLIRQKYVLFLLLLFLFVLFQI